MENIGIKLMYLGFIVFAFAIFISNGRDDTIRYVMLCSVPIMQSHLIENKKVKQIIQIVYFVLMIIVLILGFGFSYFKI